MKKFSFLLASVTALAAVFAFTDAQVWKISDTYSIQFSNSDVAGIFKKFSGTIEFDEASPATSKFIISMEVASLNTGNALQNKTAKSAEWFDAVKYPFIKFSSSKIEKAGTAYKVSGRLEMKGIKKDISFPFNFKKTGTTGVFSGEFDVNKNEYGVGKKGDGVGEIIKIKLSVPVTK